jgi:hypothetical protein
MEVCLIYFNKGEDGEVFKNLQHSEMEWKINEGLFRKYSLRYDSITMKVQ